MTPISLKDHLVKILVEFRKRFKALKLSIRQIRFYQYVLQWLRRLLPWNPHILNTFSPDIQLRLDSGIMGATQPVQNVIPVAVTLAVPPLKNVENPRSMPMSMPMNQHITAVTPHIPVAPDVRPREHLICRPMVATEIIRYKRSITQSHGFLLPKIDPGVKKPTEQSMGSSSWKQLTHPEGARYFYNPVQRVFTDEDVLDSVVASEILNVAMEAKERAATEGIALSVTTELAIERLKDSIFGYYFVDHDAQILFWPEAVRSAALMNGVRGVSGESHIRYALEAQYWKHCTLFPNMRVLCGHVFERLRDMVVYAHAESITSETSLSPFELGELSNMITLLDQVKDGVNKENDHFVCIVARYMHIFITAKFVNFCGQRGARLDADQPLYDSNSGREKHLIFRILNVALFNSLDIHLESLRKVWVDKTVVKPRWKKFVDQINSEWSSFTVFSTVMLAVDVSFLAVPGVDDPTTPFKSLTTIFIYMSTLCAMGSLVISLVLAGQINNNRRSSPGSVTEFLTSMSESLLGFESVAFMHSLPFSLLIWGMIFFAIALSNLIFSDTTDVVALIVVAPIWALIVLLATWPGLATNNLHISTVVKKVDKSWRKLAQRMPTVTTRRR